MPAILCLCCNSANTHYWTKAKDVEYFSSSKQFTFYRCQDCFCLFIFPVPKDQLSIIYPSNYYSFAKTKATVIDSVKEWLDKKYFKHILNDIKSPAINVLDVGGGEGWLLTTIKKIDKRISLTQVVDIDSHAGFLARENGHEYFCGRIEDFKSDQKFDLVLLLNLIEHVESPFNVLSAIENMLSPDGVILVKTPNYDSLDARVFRDRNWGGYHCPRHWVIFSKISFDKLLSRTNLSAVHFSYTQGAPFWTISVLAWLHEKTGWINISKDRPTYSHKLASLLNAFFAAFDFIRSPFSKTSQMFYLLHKKK